MFPLAIGFGSSVVELRQPLGVGSLVVLTLFVLLAFYYIFEDRKSKKQ